MHFFFACVLNGGVGKPLMQLLGDLGLNPQKEQLLFVKIRWYLVVLRGLVYERVELLAVTCKLKLPTLPAQGMEDGKGDVSWEKRDSWKLQTDRFSQTI